MDGLEIFAILIISIIVIMIFQGSLGGNCRHLKEIQEIKIHFCIS